METEQAVQGRRTAPEVAGHDLVRRLGAGSQAEVWLVQPRDGSPPCAAKCFLPPAPHAVTDEYDDGAPALRGGRHAGAAQRHNESEITREWRILAAFDHEHLVRLLGLVELGGAWAGGRALLMEHAAGGSLRGIVAARGPLSVGETVTVLTPLGQVLSFLHGQGAVHGDVSPGNVLFTEQGKPVLGDLGFGRLAGQRDGDGAGTPGFSCPQDGAARDDAVPDGTGRYGQTQPASDVFSLAAVGWYALTGHPPPPTLDRMPLSMYVPDVPSELTAALEAGLDEDAAKRPSAAAFAQAVYRCARAEPVELAESVDASVLPELPTRRALPKPTLAARLAARLRRRTARGRQRLRRRRFGRTPRTGLVPARGTAAGVPSPRRRTRPALRHGLAVLAAAAVMAAMLAVWWLGAGRPADLEAGLPAPPAALAGRVPDAVIPAGLPPEVAASLTSADAGTALGALAWVRSYALSSGRFELLEAVNAAGSPASAADAALVKALRGSGHTFTGLETAVARTSTSARTLRPNGGGAPYAAAVVTADVTTGPFAERDGQGAVVHRQDAAHKQRLSIVLVKAGGRWMVRQVMAPPQAGGKG